MEDLKREIDFPIDFYVNWKHADSFGIANPLGEDRAVGLKGGWHRLETLIVHRTSAMELEF
jgi:hypothetical protein